MHSKLEMGHRRQKPIQFFFEEAEDVELFDGTMGYYHSGLSSFPLVPGHEWAGGVTGSCLMQCVCIIL